MCKDAARYNNPFTDLSGTHYRTILCLSDHGVARGFGDGTYRPGQEVNRAQMATFIANLIEKERALPAPKHRFKDVDRNDTHWASMHKLAEAGVVKGRDGHTYDPAGTVTRAQMASFIARAIDYVDSGVVDGSEPPVAYGSGRFSDVPSASTHGAAIAALRDRGIVVGYRHETYGPGDHTRRDQMASFLMRAYDYLAETSS